MIHELRWLKTRAAIESNTIMISRFFAFCLGLILTASSGLAQPGAPTPRHLLLAEELVRNLKDASENSYGGGTRHIEWNERPCAARTVCSSFVTLLFMRAYDLSVDDYKRWFNRSNPMAEDYHDAVEAENGFIHVTKTRNIRPGDILAVKYNDGHVSRNGIEDTGHVMVVASQPEAIAGATDVAPGAKLYTVWVIDSSASGHGPRDSRHLGKGKFTGGIGKGMLRIAVDPASDKIVAYSWSDGRKSEFFAGVGRDLVVGRLELSKLKKNP